MWYPHRIIYDNFATSIIIITSKEAAFSFSSIIVLQTTKISAGIIIMIVKNSKKILKPQASSDENLREIRDRKKIKKNIRP